MNFDKLTGGRPMRLVEPAFTDAVSGEQVGYYRDRFGRFWLATSPWAGFRIPAHRDCEETRECAQEVEESRARTASPVWDILFILAVLATSVVSCSPAEAHELDLTGAWTRHTKENETYNNHNLGVMATADFETGFGVGAATYRDSYRKQAVAVFARREWETSLAPSTSLGIDMRAGLLSGSGISGPMLLPIPYLRVGAWKAGLVIVPAAGERAGVASLILGYRFGGGV